MASIMTNVSAMTALKSLTATNSALETTQARISTGYKVSEASDNAAYWSIATTMRSDNKALSTVQDALGLGASKVDTAYTGMTSAIEVVDEIKSKLVAAREPGVDKAKIQAEITALQGQLTSNAAASSFSGENWLSVDSGSSSYTAEKQIVSSFTRSSSGDVSVGTIAVDTAKSALFDAKTGEAGLLEKGAEIAATDDGGVKDVAKTSGTAGGGTPTAATTTLDAFGSSAITWGDDAVMTFKLAVNGEEAKTITIDKATVDAALSSTDGEIGDIDDMVDVLEKAFENAGVTSSAVVVGKNTGGTAITLTTVATGVDSSLEITGKASSTNGNFLDLATFDITNASADDLDSYISSVDKMLGDMTSAAADLGAAKKRIDLQSNFVTNLKDTIDRGVGTLVDADMNQESTKLQALQVQQQLGIQALSIANSSAQTILSLFR